MITKDTEFTFIIDINKMPFVTVQKNIDDRRSILFTLNINNPKVKIKASDLTVYSIELIHGYISSGVIQVTNKQKWDEFIEYVKSKTVKKKDIEQTKQENIQNEKTTNSQLNIIDVTIDELLKLNVNKIKAKLKELKNSLSQEEFNKFINDIEEIENKSESPRVSLLKYIIELREKE